MNTNPTAIYFNNHNSLNINFSIPFIFAKKNQKTFTETVLPVISIALTYTI